MHEIKLPQLGQSVEEASIVEWRKSEGDQVEEGEILFSIQTDKAEIECESTAAGVLRKILVEPDVDVPVLTVVALVGDPDEPLPDLAAYGAGEAKDSGTEAAGPSAQAAVSAAAAPARTTAPCTSAGAGAAVSPRARARALEVGVDPRFAAGSGAMGRVMAADVEQYAQAAAAVRISPTARRIAGNEAVDITRLSGSGPRGKVMKADVLSASGTPAGEAAGQAVPLSPMRRIIAERMVESKFSAPHYYMTMEIDMAAATAFRKTAGDPRPSYNDLILYAAARALIKHPAVNARWAGDALEIPAEVNLGFAVALPSGLVVPVVRNAQAKDLPAIHQECRALVEKARTGKLTPDEYAGSTFTVSNLGAFGVDQFTAIINQPNSAILAVGRIREKPVVIDGGIHIRPITNLTISSDHRVIDGAVAARFMGTLREYLETAKF